MSTPSLGQVVHNLTASGQTWVIDTPITSMHFDAEKNVTTWMTDWSDLDFEP